MFRAVLVDDELKGRLALKKLLQLYCENVDIVGEADSVKSAQIAIEKLNPDLLFLDVNLQDGTGFDLLNVINYQSIKVIFVTAYDHFAIKAFRFSAIDYILKPIDPDILVAAVDKIKLLQPNENQIQILSKSKNEIDQIALVAQNGLICVKLVDIVRCEADSNYTVFYVLKGSKIVVSKSLKEYEELLENHNFFRVHKSHIINLKFVKEYDSVNSQVILLDSTKIEVARRRKEVFLELLKR
jgi:two-component system LytT family response regulator